MAAVVLGTAVTLKADIAWSMLAGDVLERVTWSFAASTGRIVADVCRFCCTVLTAHGRMAWDQDIQLDTLERCGHKFNHHNTSSVYLDDIVCRRQYGTHRRVRSRRSNNPPT